jgi:hypothetical protein
MTISSKLHHYYCCCHSPLLLSCYALDSMSIQWSNVLDLIADSRRNSIIGGGDGSHCFSPSCFCCNYHYYHYQLSISLSIYLSSFVIVSWNGRSHEAESSFPNVMGYLLYMLFLLVAINAQRHTGRIKRGISLSIGFRSSWWSSHLTSNKSQTRKATTTAMVFDVWAFMYFEIWDAMDDGQWRITLLHWRRTIQKDDEDLMMMMVIHYSSKSQQLSQTVEESTNSKC